ncbi:MAG: hypothetical protein J6W09_01890 [Bacteroidales bacterium]|nr:hypothetical protein [Bacteroidales bacterium]
MLKKQYLTPEFQLYEVRLEQTILSEVEKMNEITGSWEEEDEIVTP